MIFVKDFNTPIYSHVAMIRNMVVLLIVSALLVSSILSMSISNTSIVNAIQSPNAGITSTYDYKDNVSIKFISSNASSLKPSLSSSNSSPVASNSPAELNNTTKVNTPSTISLGKKLNIVTSVSPISDIVKNVVGNKANLVGLIPEGVNSHTFELVPSDIGKVSNADLIIIDGLGLESNVEKVADEARNKNPALQILKLGDNTITPKQWIFDFS